MTKHGRGLPRKRIGRTAPNEIEAALPELEPLDELPELEPLDELTELEAVEEVDEGPVKATCSASDDAAFDTTVSIHVPEMPKPEIAEAVSGPLERIAGSFGEMLRHRQVLVRFDGDGLIGSAVKELVAKKFAPVKPLQVVVRRGFGDEKVHEGKLPTVELSTVVADGVTSVKVATADCELVDLPVAMRDHMIELTQSAKGARFVFQFSGGAKPDTALRTALAEAFRDAGATSVSVGARVLFDRDLEKSVECSVLGSKATITVSLTADDATIIDALTLILPNYSAEIDSKEVCYELQRDSADVQSFCVDFARNAGATRVAVGGQDDWDIIWPSLISVHEAKEVVLRLAANGRSRSAVLAAFTRESADHDGAVRGKNVVVDWPEGFVLDVEVLGILEKVGAELSPKRLSCTIAGDSREPICPAPIVFAADGDVHTIRIDTEAGKPKELQRALERCLPANVGALRGQQVRVEFAGDAAVSRSFKQHISTSIADAGAVHLELVEDGLCDVIFPPMLAVSAKDGCVSISIVVDGRDETQQRRALIRELDGIEIALQSVTIATSSAAQMVGEFVLELGASRVVLDGAEPMQIHPPLLDAVDKKGKEVRFVVAPTDDDAMNLRMLAIEMPASLKQAGLLVGCAATIAWPGGSKESPAVAHLVAALRDKKAAKIHLDTGEGDALQLHPEPKVEPKVEPEEIPELTMEDAVEDATVSPAPAAPAAPAAPPPEGALVSLLGRRDDANPPIVMIGVVAGDGEGHLAAVEAELGSHSARFQGRAILLVPSQGGSDLPVRRSTSLTTIMTRTVSQSAAATLVFRGPDAQGLPHFEVLQSSVLTMPVGATFRDPRRV